MVTWLLWKIIESTFSLSTPAAFALSKWCYIRPRNHPNPTTPHLFPLLHPSLNLLPHLSNLILHHPDRHLAVGLAGLQEVLDARLGAQMGIGERGEALLIRPDQAADVAHGERQHSVGGAEPDGHGHGSPQQDVAVAGHDRAGHGADEHVERAWEQLLVGLFWRR